MDANAPEARRLMEPVAAWYVSNVLLDSPPPENGVAGRIAFKTGTSYGYRDAWSVGFDGKHTIGVWVGRPDGAPVPGLVGREAAAPILFDAFARLGLPASLPHAPTGVVAASNARLPPPLRHFQPGRLAGATSAPPLRIMFPPDGARLDLSETDGKPDPVALKVTGAVAPLTVLVNGVPVSGEAGGARSGGLFFNPAGPGFSRVTVMDGSGASASVVVRVDDSTPTALGAITPEAGTSAH
jgi:penicillin-binding protein 1C